MNIDRKWIVRFILAAAGIFLAVQYWGGFTALLGAALSAAKPLLLGGAIAYILNLLVGFYERKLLRSKGGKLRRPLCILLAFLTMGLIAGLIFSLVIPELIAGIRLLGVEIEKALIWIQAQVEPNSFFYGMTEYLADSQAQLQKALEHILSAVLSGASGILSLMGSLVSGVVTVAIALIFSIYLLLGKEKLHRQVRSLMKVYLPQRLSEKLVLIARTMDHAFHSFIVGQCTEAVILGLLCTVGMLLLGLPYEPGFVHAKACIVDDIVGTIGTVNLDYRSLFLHFENNSLFIQSPVLQDLKADFLNTQTLCRERTTENITMNFGRWLLDGILRIFAPLC